ncbi:LLM class flavin-dependent oxidoreductase [Kribbella deserti]|uniref:LLM class flavin-dependent oxidoreductase n=1 Tax=Kribbella deserti TaxID=1926257 RepID=A0ABV6QP28_9ACTN
MITFGLDVPATSFGPGPMVDPVRAAQRAEALGFDFVSASDHPSGTAPSFENWTMLTWMAAHTSRLTVMSRVLGVPFRNPGLVAKMAESLSRLSGGRFALGLGAGAADGELRAFGLPVPSARDKVDGLAEAIEITRGLWTEPALSYDGRVFRTAAAPLEPKPTYPIPIWVGTFGPRALALTGRLADGWIPSLGHAPPDAIPAMRSRIAAAAESAGRDISQIELGYLLDVRLGKSDAEHVVSGTAEQIAERLIEFTRLGFTTFNLKVRDDEADRVAADVIPLVREAA